MGVLDQFVPSATGRLLSGLGQASPTADLKNVPFYTFKLMEQDGGEWNEVTLRFPPGSIHFRQPLRRQIALDLGNQAVVTEYGKGLASWALSGTHGSGWQAITDSADGSGPVTAGKAARDALLDLFEDYARQNAKRGEKGEPLLNMHLAITGGGPSEFKNEEWIVSPGEFPEDIRTNARPMGWDWSIHLIGLKRLGDESADGGSKDALTDPGSLLRAAKDELGRNAGLLDGLRGAWSMPPNASMLDRIKGLVTQAQALKNAISTDLATIRDTATSITTTARGLAQAARGTMYAVKDAVADVRAITAADLTGIAKAKQDTRAICGDLVVAAGAAQVAVLQVLQGRGLGRL